jgi:hypothetical protein
MELGKQNDYFFLDLMVVFNDIDMRTQILLLVLCTTQWVKHPDRGSGLIQFILIFYFIF